MGVQVSNYAVLKNWFAARQHWQPTVAQAKETIAVVSAAREVVELAADLNKALGKAVQTVP